MNQRASRSRALSRLVAAGAVAGVAVLLLAAAPPAQAEVWTAPAGTRIMASSNAGLIQAIDLAAAGNEYEGVQIGLRSMFRREVWAEWLPGSHPLLVENSKLHQVKFVRVTKPSQGPGLKAKAGYYPDPLIPRAFGEKMMMGNANQGLYTPGSPRSASLYVLFHVPYGTPAGAYAGGLRVVNGSEVVDLPVTLRVRTFGWTRLSVPTAFVLNVGALGNSIAGSGVKFTKQNRQTIVQGAFRMLQEHGITPLLVDALPKVKADGSVDAAAYLTAVEPYLGATGLNLPITQVPWCSWFPYQPWRRTPYDPRMVNYLASMSRFYRDNGWQDRFYGFYMDEPNGTAEERFVEAMAKTLHRGSAKAGFRAPFLVTDDPRPKRVHATLPANKFLWDDVDIWCVRYFYFFGRVPVLRKLQKQGRQVWWYTYANNRVSQMPNFILEKSLADQRVWGWLMYRWNVQGMLYWALNRWGGAKDGRNWRDPYANPLSYVTRSGQRCNGEASIIYPGYYPRYGLNDPLAPPVSSLRLEALRDGLEDLEYLRIAYNLGDGVPGLRAAVSTSVKSITWFNHKLKFGHIFKYPGYRTAARKYLAQREVVARLIETTPVR